MLAILYCYSNMGRHYIHEYLTPSEGLNLMNIMPTHMQIRKKINGRDEDANIR
jgi:hypothetical protein